MDASQLAEAVRQLEPDAVVAAPALVPSRGTLNGSALLVVDIAIRWCIASSHPIASGFYLWPAEREEWRSRPRGWGRRVRERVGSGRPWSRSTRRAAAAVERSWRPTSRPHSPNANAGACWWTSTCSSGTPAPRSAFPRTRRCERSPIAPLGEELVRITEEVLWRHPKGFAALLAPGDGHLSKRLGAETYSAAISAVRRSCDVVVLHVPRALDEVTRSGLELADRVLVVLGLDVLSFRDAKRAIEVAGLDGKCSFVVNRAGRSEIAPTTSSGSSGSRRSS